MYDVSGITQRLPSLPIAQEQHPYHSLECDLRITLFHHPYNPCHPLSKKIRFIRIIRGRLLLT
jgi:hypothetical protein